MVIFIVLYGRPSQGQHRARQDLQLGFQQRRLLVKVQRLQYRDLCVNCVILRKDPYIKPSVYPRLRVLVIFNSRLVLSLKMSTRNSDLSPSAEPLRRMGPGFQLRTTSSCS